MFCKTTHITMEKLQVQLAKEFTHGMSGCRKDTTSYKQPPLGWFMSEKFDGYRALFKYNSEVLILYERHSSTRMVLDACVSQQSYTKYWMVNCGQAETFAMVCYKRSRTEDGPYSISSI